MATAWPRRWGRDTTGLSHDAHIVVGILSKLYTSMVIPNISVHAQT